MTVNDLTFCKMQANDVDFIAELERCYFSTPWDKAALLKTLDSEYESFYVAFLGDERVGYLGYSKTFECADVLSVCIHPDHRRKGYAERFLEFVFEQMLKGGVEKVFLEVRESNAPARHLYTILGFEEDGIRKGYYNLPKEDAVLMHLSL